jgi:hypothetical protein
MKTYFESKGFKVQDHEAQEFAKYKVTKTNRCFDDLNKAVLYCIGASEGKSNDSNLMAYVDTFITMIRK